MGSLLGLFFVCLLAFLGCPLSSIRSRTVRQKENPGTRLHVALQVLRPQPLRPPLLSPLESCLVLCPVSERLVLLHTGMGQGTPAPSPCEWELLNKTVMRCDLHGAPWAHLHGREPLAT